MIQNAAEEVGEHFLRETQSVCACGDVKEEIYFFHKVRPEKSISNIDPKFRLAFFYHMYTFLPIWTKAEN